MRYPKSVDEGGAERPNAGVTRYIRVRCSCEYESARVFLASATDLSLNRPCLCGRLPPPLLSHSIWTRMRLIHGARAWADV